MPELERITKRELAWNKETTKATKDEIGKLLAPMFAIYPHVEISALTVDAYCEMLRDLQPGKLAVAIRKCMATCKFLPTVSEIRNAALAEGRPVAGNLPVRQSLSQILNLPDWPPVAGKLYRESSEQRSYRLRNTRDWKEKY